MAGSADRTTPAAGLTYEDYVNLPDDGRRYEILDGELAVTPAPRTFHQAISRNLVLILGQHLEETRAGQLYYAPVDVILADHTVLEPDVVFVRAERVAIVTERAIEGPPDLVVEILSDSTEARDRGVKMRLYARFGVAHYWIVDPDARVIETYELEDSRYVCRGRHRQTGVLESTLLPGLRIDVAGIFQR